MSIPDPSCGSRTEPRSSRCAADGSFGDVPRIADQAPMQVPFLDPLAKLWTSMLDPRKTEPRAPLFSEPNQWRFASDWKPGPNALLPSETPTTDGELMIAWRQSLAEFSKISDSHCQQLISHPVNPLLYRHRQRDTEQSCSSVRPIIPRRINSCVCSSYPCTEYVGHLFAVSCCPATGSAP